MKLLEFTIFDATIPEHVFAIGTGILFFTVMEISTLAISMYLFGDYEHSLRSAWGMDDEDDDEELEADLLKEINRQQNHSCWFKALILFASAASFAGCLGFMYFFVVIWGGFPALEVIVLSIASLAELINRHVKEIPGVLHRWWERHCKRREGTDDA